MQATQDRRQNKNIFIQTNKKTESNYHSLLVAERSTKGCTSGRRKWNPEGMRCKKKW